MHPILERHIKIQAVRIKELSGSLKGAESIEDILIQDDCSFPDKVLKRTSFLAEMLGIQQAVDLLSSRLTLSGILTCLLCGALGVLAAGNAFDNQSFDNQNHATVNFYWLILVLTGFNLLSMLIWLLALLAEFIPKASRFRSPVAEHQHTLFSGLKWLLSWLIKAKEGAIERTTLQAWIRVYHDSGLSKWAVSKSTHLLWLCYLTGGFVMVLLMLSVREYNFGWATTIVHPDTFVNLTQGLAVLPDLLGLDTPSREVIAESRLDTLIAPQTGQEADVIAASRHGWASLLLSCLFLYGILPRLLLCVYCQWQVTASLGAYKPDYTDPYFLALRRKLVPVARPLGITDPDTIPPSCADDTSSPRSDAALPRNARYLAIELDIDTEWPPANIDHTACLGQADDSESQLKALADLKGISWPLVCVVSLYRSPDRGVIRFIGEIKRAHSFPVFLMILGDFSSAAGGVAGKSADLRLDDWHRLAAQLHIPADNLIHMDVSAQETAS